MFTLSTSQIQKFVTTDFIPVVANSTVVSDVETNSGDTAPFNGAPIKVIKVTRGSGYTNNTYYAPIRGDGTGGVVKIKVDNGFGYIDYYSVLNHIACSYFLLCQNHSSKYLTSLHSTVIKWHYDFVPKFQRLLHIIY